MPELSLGIYRLALIALSLILLPSLTLAAPSLESLSKRIDELEKQQEQLLLEASEPRPQVNSFLNDNLTFGGFYESAFYVVEGSDTDLQGANASNTLGFNLAADFSPKIRFVSQFLTGLSFPVMNQHNDPKGAATREFKTLDFGANVSQGYVEYSSSRAVNIQGGMGYVPFGYAFQQRELVQFVRRNGPQILRTTNLVAPLWNGVHLHGSFDQGKNDWGYNLYSFTPLFYPKQPGAGGRIWWASEDERVVTGLSAQTGKNEYESFETFGTDLRLDLHPFILKAEYIRQMAKEDDPWSAYLEPSVFIYQEEILLYAFGDYSNSPQNKSVAVAPSGTLDPYKKWEFGAGINWLPTSFTRFRLGFTYHDYVGTTATIDGINRDYYSLNVSAGVAF
ncbi:MAG TPA: hypothetical protein VNJ01_16455 [Bacteriovoracaceae bacterium]|nr:hypothetical protein [Bacteriovoracaceae bacterium]